MKTSMIAMLVLALLIGIVGCGKQTTSSQPTAEGETPPVAEEQEVLKPVIEESAAETADRTAATTEPTRDEAQRETDPKEQPAEAAGLASETAEPASAFADGASGWSMISWRGATLTTAACCP